MIPKHTSAPWQHGLENEGYFIANGELRPDIAKAIQSLSDACVIAAAPDLLEALIDLERTAGLPAMTDDPVRVRARAAIAKATGGAV